MITYISKISFSRLKKLEVKQLASKVINAVEGFDPETLKIKEIYDYLVELQPQIESLELEYLSHPVSPKLGALRKQRFALAQGIIDQVKTIENGKIKGMEEAIIVAKPKAVQYLQGLRNYDDTYVYQHIHTFSGLLTKDAALATAFETLGLVSYLNNLKIVNNTIEEHYNVRTQDISERTKGATTGIVDKIKIALSDLFKQIEVAQVKHRELNYKPLIARLNEEIAITKAKLKTRSTNSKKRAEGELDNTVVVEKDNEVVVGDESGKPSESTESTQRMFPLSVEVGSENPDLLKIEKAVAVSGKQTRLPIVSTEA